MKILVLTPLYYIKNRPELFHDTNAVHYLVKYWAEVRHEVQVIVTYVNYRRQILRYKDEQQRQYWKHGYEYQADGVNVYLIEEQLLFNKDWFSWNNEIHLAYKIKKYLAEKAFEPEVIVNHFPCYASGYIKKLGFDVPCIGVMHQTDIKKGKQDSGFIERLNKNYCAVYSRSTGIYEEAANWKLQNLRPEIIYSGAPDNGNIEVSKDFSETHKFSFLYAGKLIRRKNIDLLIETVSENTDITLDVIGDGEQRQDLEKLVNHLQVNDRVHFLGTKNREEVLERMHRADVFCMPSVKETFGLVYIEAMRQGCITIGTLNEGIDGIIQDGKNGFLCKPTKDGVQEVIQRIQKLSETDLSKISKEAIQTGITFSEKNVSIQYLNLVKGWCENEN